MEIGKSCFLTYALVKRLSQKKATALVLPERPGTCFLFTTSSTIQSEMKEEFHTRLAKDRDTLGLCDTSPESMTAPP